MPTNMIKIGWKLFDLESGNPVDAARPPARRRCSHNTSRFSNRRIKNKMLNLPILHAVLVWRCSDGNKWVYLNAILYVFVIMTIYTTTVSSIHFTYFVLFGTLQSKWRLILCVTCFCPTALVSVQLIFTSCLTECPTLFFNFREVCCLPPV